VIAELANVHTQRDAKLRATMNENDLERLVQRLSAEDAYGGANWDRGSSTSDQEVHYGKHADELNLLVVRVRDAYKNLIVGFHERLRTR
jgi:hypothetical protein